MLIRRRKRHQINWSSQPAHRYTVAWRTRTRNAVFMQGRHKHGNPSSTQPARTPSSNSTRSITTRTPRQPHTHTHRRQGANAPPPGTTHQSTCTRGPVEHATSTQTQQQPDAKLPHSHTQRNKSLHATRHHTLTSIQRTSLPLCAHPHSWSGANGQRKRHRIDHRRSTGTQLHCRLADQDSQRRLHVETQAQE
jgi:hypothetical protein